MNYQRLGRTDLEVSAVGFGAWAIGGFWGPVDDGQSMQALHAAVDAGTTFIDTADVYGNGRSERLVGQLLRERPGERLVVATKAGRRLPAQVPEGYTRANLETWVNDSLANLRVDALDLLQLHCPPPALYARADVFGVLDDFVAAGKIRYYGVSVETIDEARMAMRHPNVQSVQIIFNLFRHKPAEAFLAEAAARQVGVIARVPLASGLLTGALRPDTTFAADDHRTFNRRGEMFDVGETFAGVPLEAAFPAVDELAALVPEGATMGQFALRWILMHPGVTCTIPGARTERQARENAAAADLAPLPASTMTAVRRIYDSRIRDHVRGRW
jgi:aryl-alcohol dehydrogenase-like predicted oxidoreductase